MLGFDSLDEARQGYLANYQEGWKGLGGITELTMERVQGVDQRARPRGPSPTKCMKWTPWSLRRRTRSKQERSRPEKPAEPIREERNRKEVKPGVTLRMVSEDLMSGDPQKVEVAIAMLVNAVRSGKVSKEDALNVRNELMAIAWEKYEAAGKPEGKLDDFYRLTEAPAKRLAEAEREMVEPGAAARDYSLQSQPEN